MDKPELFRDNGNAGNNPALHLDKFIAVASKELPVFPFTRLYEEAKARAAESEQTVRSLEEKIRDGEQMKESLSERFDTMKSWADMYDGCDKETKKMILSRMMSAVRVKRDYEIEIDLAVDCEQLGINAAGGFAIDDKS